MGSGAFFPKGNFVFWWGLRPNLPRPWADPRCNLGSNLKSLLDDKRLIKTKCDY